MLKKTDRRSLFLWLAGSLLSGFVPTVLAVNYTAVPGSIVIIQTHNNQKITDETSYSQGFVLQTTNRLLPFMGGFAMPNSGNFYACASSSNIVVKDGWKGMLVNSVGIIAGASGSLTGAVSVIQPGNSVDKITYSGGLSFDNRGFASPIGDASLAGAEVLCAGDYPPSQSITVSGAGATGWGNYPASFTGSLWIYVPKDITPGTYNLVNMGLVQGSSFLEGFSGNAYLPMTKSSDTINVIPPPCTISTQTSITFDTSSTGGKTVRTRLGLSCGELTSSPELEAHLLAFSISEQASPTELRLTTAENNPGGIVRGYVGNNALNDSSQCIDTNSSLYIDGRFGTVLGTVLSDTYNMNTLVWQLCTSGNESPGKATGSLILELAYK